MLNSIWFTGNQYQRNLSRSFAIHFSWYDNRLISRLKIAQQAPQILHKFAITNHRELTSSFIVLKVLPPTLNYVERGKGEKVEAKDRALRTSTTLQPQRILNTGQEVDFRMK